MAAVTGNPPAVIQTLIDAHINGFNTQTTIFSSAFSETPLSSSTALRHIAG